jgi:hypothetical protein
VLVDRIPRDQAVELRLDAPDRGGVLPSDHDGVGAHARQVDLIPPLLRIHPVLPVQPPRRRLDETGPLEQGGERARRTEDAERRDRDVVRPGHASRLDGLRGDALHRARRVVPAGEGQSPACAQHPAQLHQRGFRVARRVDDEIAGHRVELTVRQGQVRQHGHPPVQARHVARGGFGHAGLGVHGCHVGPARDRGPGHHPRAGPDVQQPGPGLHPGRIKQRPGRVRGQLREPALVGGRPTCP